MLLKAERAPALIIVMIMISLYNLKKEGLKTRVSYPNDPTGYFGKPLYFSIVFQLILEYIDLQIMFLF